MKNRWTTGLLALALASLLALPASASTFVAMDEIDLVAAADAVVVGEVIDIHSFWNQRGTLIVTEATVLIKEVVAGDAPAEITVRTMGGEVSGYKVEAHGFPTFEPGQTQLMMLHRAADGSLQVAGYRQGQFRVLQRADGTRVAMPMVGDARFLTKDGEVAPAPRALPLETLKNNLRTVRAQLDRVARPAIR